MFKIVKYGLLTVLGLSLLGAKCSKGEVGKVKGEFKDIPITEVHEVLQKTAIDMGIEAHLIEVDKGSNYPAQILYNGFRIVSIQKMNSYEEYELKRFAQMFKLKEFDLNSFTKDLCDNKPKRSGSSISNGEIAGYKTCNYFGELDNISFAGTTTLIGNYILVSDKPPPRRKNVLNEETGVHEQVIVEGWSWDHQRTTETLVSNFLEKYK
jgi:hypothetical protein